MSRLLIHWIGPMFRAVVPQSLSMTVLVVLLGQIGSTAIAADMLAEKIEIAEDAFNSASEELKLAARIFIEKEIVEAKSDGRSADVERLESELQFFEDRGYLPISAPRSLHQDQMTAVKRYIKVSDAVIRGYTKKGDRTAAQLVEEKRAAIAAVGTRALTRSQLVGVWSLKTPGYSTTFIFKPNGTLTHTTARAELNWEVNSEKGIVLCKGDGFGTETILLPINPRGTRGYGENGNNWLLKKIR